MLRYLPLVFLLLACNARTPTEPIALDEQQAAPAEVATNDFYSCSQAGAYMEPTILAMRADTSIDVKVRVCYGPAALPWDIRVGGPPGIATGSSRVEPGQWETTLHITALSEGVADVYYVVGNFGRAPSVRTIGQVYVGTPKRRAVR